MCSRDAATTIVKVTLQIKDASALMFTDDTDSLLIHYVDTSLKRTKTTFLSKHDKKEIKQ